MRILVEEPISSYKKKDNPKSTARILDFINHHIIGFMHSYTLTRYLTQLGHRLIATYGSPKDTHNAIPLSKECFKELLR